MLNRPTKQVATTDYAIEGDFISADEWNEDQFNKAESTPSQEDLAMRFRAEQMQGQGPNTLEAMRAANQAALDTRRAYNQSALDLQRRGFNQGYGESTLGSIFGRGLFK